MSGLPYRGTFGESRPEVLGALTLPPQSMPSRQGLRPLKAWRYIGVFGPELMLCVATVRVGRARQCFWAIWDRAERRLYERTRLGHGAVSLAPGRVRVSDGAVEIELTLTETAGIETICPSARSYGWTRKQGGIRARGTVSVGGKRRSVDAGAVIDDTAAYYQRHTSWFWSAGVGLAVDARELAWNLVQGVNDPPQRSERTVWVQGEPVEAAPVRFAPDLSGVSGHGPTPGSVGRLGLAPEAVGRLVFTPETVREHRQNLGLVRSRYRQPFGTFAGELLPGVELAEGYGVMEEHDVWW